MQKVADCAASSRSLVKYFTGPIGHDEDEFLERFFFYDHLRRNRSRRQL